MTSIVWFRRDLRLSDNPALLAAVARGQPIVPLFILDDADCGSWLPGGASRWWLSGSLASLDASLRALGSTLVLRRGTGERVLDELIAETGAHAVFWNRRYEPWARARDARIKSSLQGRGIVAESFNASLLCEPWELKTAQGGPYRVFTPFRRALFARGTPGVPCTAPERLLMPDRFPASDDLPAWRLRPSAPDWASGFSGLWSPGESGAQARLGIFLAERLDAYAGARDRPAVMGTSMLSPHLHFGEIGPRQIVSAVRLCGDAAPGTDSYLSEIAWRDFSYHLLYHFPDLPERPLRSEFLQFPWREDEAGLAAWQHGKTGYPIVDAGLRALWETGWMHNRVRMIAASFLVKDLMIPWQAGARWFWDTLVDADLASNSASWQWVSGCGADAAPYFRIFNPVLQGEKFDAAGDYVRRFVPELARLPNALLHAPWRARPIDLADAGVELGTTYPRAIVDHDGARRRALDAYRQIRHADG